LRSEILNCNYDISDIGDNNCHYEAHLTTFLLFIHDSANIVTKAATMTTVID